MEKSIRMKNCEVVLRLHSSTDGEGETDNIDAYDFSGKHLWNIADMEGMSRDRYSYTDIWKEDDLMFYAYTFDKVAFCIEVEQPHIVRTKFPSFAWGED